MGAVLAAASVYFAARTYLYMKQENTPEKPTYLRYIFHPWGDPTHHVEPPATPRTLHPEPILGDEGAITIVQPRPTLNWGDGFGHIEW